MAPFALSVPGYRLGVHGPKRRRRDGDERDSLSPSPIVDPSTSHLPSNSINPLSHTPGTLRQFAVAGLAPEEELPSTHYPSFPHKPLPPDYPARDKRKRYNMSNASGAESGAETDTTATTGNTRSGKETTLEQHSAKLKSLNTMTAIMHRCLNDGDIARAKRAFGLLVQTKDIDIRLNNLWAIGSEILMRDGETEYSRRQSGSHIEEQQAGMSTDEASNLPPRWGSAANVEKVKNYFENLIQQHPYDPHRPQLTSAIDFWPALLGIEIYNLNAEFQRALHRLDTEEQEPEPEEPEEMIYSDDEVEARRQRREDAGLEHLWAAKDELRRETQTATQQIATRMDQLMENAPFTTHKEMLRLRGNISLFVGDLYLPARLAEQRDVIEHRMQGLSLMDKDLRDHADGAEERNALGKRKEEHEKARSFFQRILDNRGQVDGWIQKFMEAEEDEQDADIEDESLLSL